MNNTDRTVMAVLTGLAAFIWFRDTRWMSSAADCVPILVAIPLFVWLGGPWRFEDRPVEFNNSLLMIGGIFFALGMAGNLTFLLSLAWTVLMWSWLRNRIYPELARTAKYLLPLPFLAMPWITLDGAAIGWWFRLSGAAVTSAFFKLMAFRVEHDGTFININGVPISVEAACAGLNTLQSMLIAGVALAFVLLNSRRYFWLNVALLIPLAWLANTVRIVVLSGAALTFSSEFVSGTFHDLSGWLVIMVMFLVCWAAFALQNKWIPKTTTAR
jgi:exosortase